MAQIRIGQGFDVHKFGGEGPIILGGVPIPYEFGFIAHSDGDVVLHALTDAILGALALGDIGTHFSDKSDEFKGVDSRILLKKSHEMVLAKGFQLVNADMTIIAQAPLMRDHIPQMRINIAETLGVHFEQISVKATTTERLGFTGRKEGIAAEAIVLLEQMSRS